MSDDPGIAEILVSQLGSPRDYGAEWVGAMILLLAALAYFGLEYGLGRLIVRCWRAIRHKDNGQRDDR